MKCINTTLDSLKLVVYFRLSRKPIGPTALGSRLNRLTGAHGSKHTVVGALKCRLINWISKAYGCVAQTGLCGCCGELSADRCTKLSQQEEQNAVYHRSAGESVKGICFHGSHVNGTPDKCCFRPGTVPVQG